MPTDLIDTSAAQATLAAAKRDLTKAARISDAIGRANALRGVMDALSRTVVPDLAAKRDEAIIDAVESGGMSLAAVGRAMGMNRTRINTVYNRARAARAK
jgi:hypothetical protein